MFIASGVALLVARMAYSAAVGTSKMPRGRREKGNIEALQSGALRVRVYAGIDPVTKRAHYLRAVVPAGTPKAHSPINDRMGSVSVPASRWCP